MKLKLIQLALLVATAQHYKLGNRGVLPSGVCSYAKGCAVGRLIKNKKTCKKLDDQSDSSAGAVFKMFPKSVQKYGEAFLIDLQGLHDTEYNWDNNGLTARGESRVQEITEAIFKGDYAVTV